MDQGLPTNYENTAGTWQNMPGMAALYTGMQNQSAQDNIRMLQEAFAREQAFKEQERPTQLNNLMAQGELQRAQAAQAMANARGLTVDAKGKEGLLQSNIEAGQSKNQTQMAEDKTKQLDAYGQRFASLATIAKDPNIPSFMKVQQVMQALQIPDPDGTVARGMLANIQKLPAQLEAQANHYFQNSAAAKLEAMKEAGATKRTGMNNATTLEAARIAATSRENVAATKSQGTAKNILDSVNAGKMTYEKAATAFAVMAEMETDPNLAAQYKQMAGKFEQAVLSKAAASSTTGKLSVPEATGLPTQAPITVFGNQQGPKQGTPENPIKLD
jgi:uncharacterized protein (UPF0147 family)